MSLKYLFGLIVLLVAVVIYNINDTSPVNIAQPHINPDDKTSKSNNIKNTKISNTINNPENINKKTNEDNNNVTTRFYSDISVDDNQYEQQIKEVTNIFFDPSNADFQFKFKLLKIWEDNSQIIRGDDRNYLLLSKSPYNQNYWQADFYFSNGTWSIIDIVYVDPDSNIDKLVTTYLNSLNSDAINPIKLESPVSFEVHQWQVIESVQPTKRDPSTKLSPSLSRISKELLKCISRSNSITPENLLLKSTEKLLTIHSIICNGDTNLNGIETWDHIQNLQIYNVSEIDSFTLNIISNLPNLEILVLTGSLNKRIDLDLSYLSNLSKLKYLKIENVNLTNLHAISDLEELSSIDINNSNINSLNFLSGLELSEISIQQGELESFDLFEKFYNLHSINLWGNNISDISNFENIDDLKYINLGNNKINTISSLEKFKNLDYLFLGGNDIFDCNIIEKKYLLKRSHCN